VVHVHMMTRRRKVYSVIWETFAPATLWSFSLGTVVGLLGSKLTALLSILGHLCSFLVPQRSAIQAFASLDGDMPRQGWRSIWDVGNRFAAMLDLA
jgi:hypothetical protein